MRPRIMRAASRPTTKAEAANFVGAVLSDPVYAPEGPSRLRASRVTFMPGGRTNWHQHAVGQILYVLSGVGLGLTGWAFMLGWLDAMRQALAWSGVFFLASAAASSAYLTVSEVFPLEMRALAISIFYAVGTGAGGFAAPWLFGLLIDTACSPLPVFDTTVLHATAAVDWMLDPVGKTP